MSEINIAIDIDGVVAKTIKEVCKGLEEDYENVNSWKYLSDKYGIRNFFNMYRQAWQWQDIEVCEGIRELLQTFNQLALDWSYVTAIPKDVIGYTAKWLDENDLYFNNPIVKVDKSLDKLELGYTHYIDDCGELAKYIKGNKILFLVQRNWNKEIQESKNVIIVKEYSKIIDYLK